MFANAVEGVQGYGKSQSGDLTRSFNFIRDTAFGGDEGNCQIFKGSIYTCDVAHNVIKVEEVSKDAASNARGYSYDLKNRLTHIQENEKVAACYFYSQNDQLIKEVSGANYSAILDDGPGTTYRYDLKGNHIQTVNPLGQVVETNEYDPAGNLLVQKDALGNPITYEYTIADGFVYSYRYTTEGYLKSKSTCGKTLIAYTYNQDGQIASIKDVTGKATYYSYDILGRIDELTDDKEKILAKYTYLPNNLIESITYCNAIKTVYSYDSDQNLSHLLTITTDCEKL